MQQRRKATALRRRRYVQYAGRATDMHRISVATWGGLRAGGVCLGGYSLVRIVGWWCSKLVWQAGVAGNKDRRGTGLSDKDRGTASKRRSTDEDHGEEDHGRESGIQHEEK